MNDIVDNLRSSNDKLNDLQEKLSELLCHLEENRSVRRELLQLRKLFYIMTNVFWCVTMILGTMIYVNSRDHDFHTTEFQIMKLKLIDLQKEFESHKNME